MATAACGSLVQPRHDWSASRAITFRRALGLRDGGRVTGRQGGERSHGYARLHWQRRPGGRASVGAGARPRRRLPPRSSRPGAGALNRWGVDVGMVMYRSLCRQRHGPRWWIPAWRDQRTAKARATALPARRSLRRPVPPSKAIWTWTQGSPGCGRRGDVLLAGSGSRRRVGSLDRMAASDGDLVVAWRSCAEVALGASRMGGPRRVDLC